MKPLRVERPERADSGIAREVRAGEGQLGEAGSSGSRRAGIPSGCRCPRGRAPARRPRALRRSTRATTTAGATPTTSIAVRTPPMRRRVIRRLGETEDPVGLWLDRNGDGDAHADQREERDDQAASTAARRWAWRSRLSPSLIATGTIAEATSASATPTYIAIRSRWLRLRASDRSVNSNTPCATGCRQMPRVNLAPVMVARRLRELVSRDSSARRVRRACVATNSRIAPPTVVAVAQKATIASNGAPAAGRPPMTS